MRVYSLIKFISPASSFLKEQCGKVGEMRASMPAFCHFWLMALTKSYLFLLNLSNSSGVSYLRASKAVTALPFPFLTFKKFLIVLVIWNDLRSLI